MTERDRPLEESLESHSEQPPTEAERALEREAKLPLTGWQQEVSKGLELGLQGADSIIDRSIPRFLVANCLTLLALTLSSKHHI
jgi:agmatinase